AFVLTFASVARAQKPAAQNPAEAPWEQSQGNRVGLQFDAWGASAEETVQNVTYDHSITSLTWVAVGQIRLFEHIYGDVELPWTYAHRSLDVVSAPKGVPAESSSGGRFVF